MELKPGAKFVRLTAPLVWIVWTLDTMVAELDWLPRIVITSINDSETHKAGSRHYTDEAMDLRAHNFPQERREEFRAELERRLNAHPKDPNKFIVLREYIGTPREHYHVQVRKGEVFLG